MRIEMRARKEPDVELIGLSVAGMVLPFLAIWLVWLGGELPRNALHDSLGWTCVLCGGTRSLIHLFSGELAEAIKMNPLVAFGSLGLLAWCVYAASAIAFSLPRFRVAFESLTELRVFVGGVALLLLANWGYVWLTGVNV